MTQVSKKIFKERNKSSNVMEMVHIHAQSTFLPFLYLTWYTTDIALLEPEAQLYQHLRKSSNISLTCLPFRNIFCMPCMVNSQMHFTVNNHVADPLFSKLFCADIERRKGECCNTLR